MRARKGLEGGKIASHKANATSTGIILTKAGEMTRHLASAFLDSLFLALWAVPNVYIGRFVEDLHVAGIDKVVLQCLQCVFGISTLAPICIWMYKDIRIMIKHVNREIEAVNTTSNDHRDV